MRTSKIKKATPFLALTLGILGSIGTMSMKNSNTESSVIGYAENAQGQPCQVEVECVSTGVDYCRVNYPFGKIAMDKPSTICAQPLFRP